MRVESAYGLYLRLTPAFLRRRLQPFISSPQTLLQFALYAIVSAFTLVLEVLLLRLFVAARVSLPVAVTGAYAIAVTAHFSLNKYVSFRSHTRPVIRQARTYLVIILCNWAATLAFVEVAVTFFGLSPVAARICAIPFFLPFSFLGHRYLTFGAGILAAIARWRNRSTPVTPA